MSKGKINKGSCNHYARFAGKVLHRHGMSGAKLDKTIDRYASKVADAVIKKLLKKWAL